MFDVGNGVWTSSMSHCVPKIYDSEFNQSVIFQQWAMILTKTKHFIRCCSTLKTNNYSVVVYRVALDQSPAKIYKHSRESCSCAQPPGTLISPPRNPQPKPVVLHVASGAHLRFPQWVMHSEQQPLHHHHHHHHRLLAARIYYASKLHTNGRLAGLHVFNLELVVVYFGNCGIFP